MLINNGPIFTNNHCTCISIIFNDSGANILKIDMYLKPISLPRYMFRLQLLFIQNYSQ